ncbi:hypothetical protein SAMN06297129_1054 [Pseudooceanicola antarcticus]|uniref:Uncharacterized protein n=1 Tax=Pseudooceanicola antarcticus TaxID=1247613 RepID=A0A285IFW5_9RHOB|nr:hypothetical protein [Pseudooceanicola antarcticus]PJE29072.1 hypothetical protein CVM39_11570 [Pseudooceanicola antarcticus]SNY46864.1 hypothetical protein SAMN06297129_1054 [Pseudooceanicola antarcticus]
MTTYPTVFLPDLALSMTPAQATIYTCMAGTAFWLAAYNVNMAMLRGMGFPVAAPAEPRHATPV